MWIEISRSVLHLSINPKILIFRSLKQYHVILPADTSSTTTRSMLIFCGRCCNVFNFHFSYLSLSLDYIFFCLFSRIWVNNSSNNSLFEKKKNMALRYFLMVLLTHCSHIFFSCPKCYFPITMHILSGSSARFLCSIFISFSLDHRYIF